MQDVIFSSRISRLVVMTLLIMDVWKAVKFVRLLKLHDVKLELGVSFLTLNANINELFLFRKYTPQYKGVQLKESKVFISGRDTHAKLLYYEIVTFCLWWGLLILAFATTLQAKAWFVVMSVTS